MPETGFANVYPCTEFEVSSFTHSKDTAHVPLNGWIREGVCPNSRVDLRRYLQKPHQIWHHCLTFNVLDFRYVFALSNYGANCLRLGTKNGTNFGFFGPVHFEEIGIAKVLLNTNPRRVGEFRECRFSDVWEGAVREKKKEETSVKYNGSLALVMLEQATIINVTRTHCFDRQNQQANTSHQLTSFARHAVATLCWVWKMLFSRCRM